MLSAGTSHNLPVRFGPRNFLNDSIFNDPLQVVAHMAFSKRVALRIISTSANSCELWKCGKEPLQCSSLGQLPNFDLGVESYSSTLLRELRDVVKADMCLGNFDASNCWTAS
jgi:hypothetical protein